MPLAITRIAGTRFSHGQLGSLPVIVDDQDYVNATALCAGTDKDLVEWSLLPETQSYKRCVANHLVEEDSPACSTGLSYVVDDGPEETRGIYVHPRLVINLAMWCSVEYGLMVTDIVGRTTRRR